MFQFSLGSFGVLLIFDDLVSRKRLAVEQNGPKFVTLGYLVYRVLLTGKCSSYKFRVIWRISDFRRPCMLKNADPRTKRTKIWASVVFTVYRFHVQFGVIQCLSNFWRPCISEMASCRSKTDKNFSLWGKYLVYIKYFWQLSVQVQFGYSGAFPIFDNLVSQKPVVIERNEPKCQPQREVFRTYRALTPLHFQLWRPCIYFWLKYLGIYVLSLYLTVILLSSKWPSRVQRPLGLLLAFVRMHKHLY